MAQVADFNIANASGAAVRSDLNAVFEAIKTCNSGGSDPTNPEAFMFYADTADNNNLKIRNSANNGFTTIGSVNSANLGLLPVAGGTMTGQLLGDDSSGSGSPAYAFDSDTDTGMFRNGANTIGFSTAGTERAVINSDGFTIRARGDVRFGDSDSSNYVALQSPATVSSNVTFTLPGADGSSGQFIKTDGSGNLSFATVSTFSGDASALTGTSLASNVVSTSITSLGTLSSLAVSGTSTLPTVNSTTVTATNVNSTTAKATTLKTNATNRVATAFQNSSGTEIGRLANTYVNFNGTGTVAINDDLNVSSITDNGTGAYTINFTTAMADVNYSVGLAWNIQSVNNRSCGTDNSNYTTSGFKVTIEDVTQNYASGTSRQDCSRISVAVFGNT
tara:strand:- start:987 stop:2156 length:1170 start_codon:yes stop_codon:yes gene_type:complete